MRRQASDGASYAQLRNIDVNIELYFSIVATGEADATSLKDGAPRGEKSKNNHNH